jgi:hypothetical protein
MAGHRADSLHPRTAAPRRPARISSASGHYPADADGGGRERRLADFQAAFAQFDGDPTESARIDAVAGDAIESLQDQLASTLDKARQPMHQTRTELIKVLLVADIDLLRTALVDLLVHEQDMTIVADVQCTAKVVAMALWLQPDVVVDDVDPPNSSGLTLVRELRSRMPHCQIVACLRDLPEY